MKTHQAKAFFLVLCFSVAPIFCRGSKDRTIYVQAQFGFLVKDIKMKADQTPAQAFEQCRKQGECGGEEALKLTFGKRVIQEGTQDSYKLFHELSESGSRAEIDEQKKESVAEWTTGKHCALCALCGFMIGAVAF